MFRPEPTLTVANAQTVFKAGLRAIADGQTQFDLSALTVTDSAAVATMLAWQRAARRADKVLVFSQIPASLQSLCELYDVADMLAAPSTAASRTDLPHH
jgi:phospholipid transport system transporter-binding protein